MAKLIFAEEFIAGMAEIESKRLRDRIVAFITNLEDMPQMGSPDVRPTIKACFGARVRKLVVSPFDIFYLYLPDEDEVHVAAIRHQRQIR